jgi:hypothetical protein
MRHLFRQQADTIDMVRAIHARSVCNALKFDFISPGQCDALGAP